jgi:hypothetical protein
MNGHFPVHPSPCGIPKKSRDMVNLEKPELEAGNAPRIY